MLGPLAILGISVVFIVAAIVLFRLQAFFALMLAAILVAILASPAAPHRLVKAIAGATDAFGAAAGKIGFTLALAAVIGVSLMESGAADRIVRWLISFFGEKHAGAALLVSSFLLSAPVFYDTVLMLLLPLARAMSLRTGKDYLLYVLAVGGGGIIANATMPPAPGPLLAADMLKVNLGVAIVAGVVFGILPAFCALTGARFFNRKFPLNPRNLPGASVESLEALAAKPTSELPGFLAALMPVLVPVVLISAASTLVLLKLRLPGPWGPLIEVLGDKNVALLLGAVLAVGVHARYKRVSWRKAGALLGPPLEMAGVIILIISAGSAYGESIKHAGLDEAVRRMAGGHSINYVLLGWTLATVMRGAQGSATVAMITAAGITASVAGTGGFGVHPFYVLLAIGYGSKTLAWMNDSGFWLISRIGGLSQNEALRSWSPVAALISVVGLAEVWIASSLWPHLPGLHF